MWFVGVWVVGGWICGDEGDVGRAVCVMTETLLCCLVIQKEEENVMKVNHDIWKLKKI